MLRNLSIENAASGNKSENIMNIQVILHGVINDQLQQTNEIIKCFKKDKWLNEFFLVDLNNIGILDVDKKQ